MGVLPSLFRLSLSVLAYVFYSITCFEANYGPVQCELEAFSACTLNIDFSVKHLMSSRYWIVTSEVKMGFFTEGEGVISHFFKCKMLFVCFFVEKYCFQLFPQAFYFI